MKIVFATDTLDRGGKERQLALLFSSLETGQQTRIWTKHYNPENNYLEEFGIGASLIKQYNGWRAFQQLIKNEKPDLVFTWDIQSSLYALLLKPFYGYRFWNGSIRHGIRGRKFSHLLRSLVAWLSPLVIANSVAGLKANNMRLSEKNKVLYNGIDPKFSEKKNPEQRNILVRKLFPDYEDGKDMVLISVANFLPYKDYFSVLEVMKELKNEIPFRYIIIGSGPLKQDIETRIKEYGLQDRIILVGRTNEVVSYLQSADLMVHSSKGEGLSNAILEAMYAGLPVIASNVGGVPETVFPAYSRLFEYRNTEQLKEALLSAKELITKFNNNDPAYQIHLQKFSVESMIGDFNMLLKLHA